MTTGDKIARLRRENNYTQEQLAEILGVSRQSISKWEQGSSYPETDKLIRLGELFNCSVDYLLKDGAERCDESSADKDSSDLCVNIGGIRLREMKSQSELWGMPLWHIGRNANGVFAVGVNAKGIVAIGLRAKGIVSAGLFSTGLFSFGTLSLGLVSIGLLSLGLLSAGCFSIGVLSAGAISMGIISVGAIAFGDFTVGALSIGKYFAYGASSKGMIAIGDDNASGSLFRLVGEMTAQDKEIVKHLLDENVPAYLSWAKNIIELFL